MFHKTCHPNSTIDPFRAGSSNDLTTSVPQLSRLAKPKGIMGSKLTVAAVTQQASTAAVTQQALLHSHYSCAGLSRALTLCYFYTLPGDPGAGYCKKVWLSVQRLSWDLSETAMFTSSYGMHACMRGSCKISNFLGGLSAMILLIIHNFCVTKNTYHTKFLCNKK